MRSKISAFAFLLAALATQVVLTEPTVDFGAPIPPLPFGAEAVEKMCRSLESEEVQVQYDAARYFLHHGKLDKTSPAAVDCLLKAVERGAIQPVQAHAGFALVEYGSAAVPGLMEIMGRNRENNAYWVAVGMLNLLGPEAELAGDEMLRILKNGRASARERLDAADVLFKIGDPEQKSLAYRVMLEVAESADTEASGAAAFSITRTRNLEAVRFLVRCARENGEVGWRVMCVTELGNVAAGLREPLDSAEALRCLKDLRDDPEELVRASVRRALDY
ncbi:MAG: hypothetical protein AAGM22_16765 [Acidobacteriota bacterium]